MKDLTIGNALFYNKQIEGKGEQNIKIQDLTPFAFTFSKTYSYSYDALSNKATYTSPEGKTYAYTYNKNNQPTNIAFDGKTIGLTYQWDRLTKATLPNNVTTDYQYNANSWLNYITTKQGATTHLDKRYDFDKVGNITKKTDDASIVTDYNYDSTYQLTSLTNPSLAETFTYDKTGNRIQSTDSRTQTINYQHNTNNEMTQSCIGDPASCIVYQYDANGNTIQETNGTQITKYIYNSSNRLEKVELPDGRIAEYKYDPFGRRISKTINNSASADGHTTYYLYADEGLIGEYDSAGNNIKSYGWIPDSIWGTNPVFMLENNNYYFYHNDHLGTPQKMTDEAGNVVWSATYTAFGEATVDSGSTITNNLRFPGQYFDSETGKHYNWNRYYDPKTGRYTQVDPIGFGGRDANLYRYVWNQPNSGIDPLGLLNFTFDPDYLVGPQAIYNTGAGLINLFLSKDNKIDPIKIFNISYTLSIDAGEQYGEEAALYWAQKQVDNRDKWYSPIYAIPGLFASLWTDCTSDATLATLTAAYGAGKAVGTSKGLGNPFKGKTPQEIDEMFRSKGFKPTGPDPVSGKGGYVNPKTERSYHIDPNNRFNEPPHVDVNRPKGYNGPLEKKKYFTGGN